MITLSDTESKVRAVLKVGGPMTRHQLLERSGFSRETVRRVTTNLIKKGFVKQIGEAVHLANKGMSGPLFALTEEKMPADALNDVIHQWVRAA